MRKSEKGLAFLMRCCLVDVASMGGTDAPEGSCCGVGTVAAEVISRLGPLVCMRGACDLPGCKRRANMREPEDDAGIVAAGQPPQIVVAS